MELAILEGVEKVFDLMVCDIVESRRASALKRMLEVPGTAPSLAMKQSQTLESALEKIDHNLRSQYEKFLASYVSTREAIFTPEQILEFITTLRNPLVQSYIRELRNFRKELNTPIMEVLRCMTIRAVKGEGESSAISRQL
jgi:hypothetical protein